MIRAESTSVTCSVCGEEQGQGAVVVTIGEAVIALCQDCGSEVSRVIADKLWQGKHSVPSVPSREELTSLQVASFATCPLGPLLDDLVTCTVRYIIGPLDGDERRIATALLERLATLGVGRKVHRAGCEVWPKYRLCNCPWEVGSGPSFEQPEPCPTCAGKHIVSFPEGDGERILACPACTGRRLDAILRAKGSPS